MRRVICQFTRAVPLAGCLCITDPAFAIPIYESAILGPTGIDPSGPPINVHATQWSGVRFTLDDAAWIDTLGGHLICCQSGESLFLALVPLNETLMPSSFGLSDAIGVGLITDTSGLLLSREYRVVIPRVLVQPGAYAIIAGTGLFGATGEGWVPMVDTDFPRRAIS